MGLDCVVGQRALYVSACGWWSALGVQDLAAPIWMVASRFMQAPARAADSTAPLSTQRSEGSPQGCAGALLCVGGCSCFIDNSLSTMHLSTKQEQPPTHSSALAHNCGMPVLC